MAHKKQFVSDRPKRGFHQQTFQPENTVSSPTSTWVRDGYRLVKCHGEAHSNPFIDHCIGCMSGTWGWAVAEGEIEPPAPSISKKIMTDYYKTKLPWPDFSRKQQPFEHARMRRAYQDDQRRLEEEFKRDALEDVGMTGHPKAELLWSKAWDLGHSAGYGEVYNYLADLVELVK